MDHNPALRGEANQNDHKEKQKDQRWLLNVPWVAVTLSPLLWRWLFFMGCDPLVFLEIPLFPGSFFLVFLHSLHSVTLLSLAQSGGGERKEENQEENQEAKKRKRKRKGCKAI